MERRGRETGQASITVTWLFAGLEWKTEEKWEK